MADNLDRKAKAQAAAPRQGRGPNKIVVGGIVAIVAIIAVVAGVILADQQKKTTTTAGGSDLPAGVTQMGGPLEIAAGKSGVPVLDIYEDFQCPACSSLESAVGPTITDMITKKQITVRYHVMSFLDGNLDQISPNKQSSNRAANGAMCAAEDGKFLEYHNALFQNHPQEGKGWTDAELTTKAKDAGLKGESLTKWEQCFAGKPYNQYVASIDDQAAKDGVTATPTLKLNGEKLDLAAAGINNANDFRTHILAAKN
ncbi:DsbA family protein [Kribbia dieselivorans]|uniref:DsbA family protein n=1 Tax=Kribbia dieselivorans TaxID=331526 RepID=UPI000837AE7D|nr:thioredoxin domain-containing protein [Kribbia dieselivorans]